MTDLQVGLIIYSGSVMIVMLFIGMVVLTRNGELSSRKAAIIIVGWSLIWPLVLIKDLIEAGAYAVRVLIADDWDV